MAVALTQRRFRFRSDTLTVDDASVVWAANESVNWIPTPVQHGVPFRVRFEVISTGNTAFSSTINLRAQKNGAGGFTTVTTSRNDGIQMSSAASVDADNTSLATGRLTSDGSTWANGQYDNTGTTGTISLAATTGRTEVEFGIVLTSAALAGDYFDLELYRSSTLITQYSGQTPRITLTEAALTAANLTIPAFGSDLGKPALLRPGQWDWAPGDQTAKYSDGTTGTSVSVTKPANVVEGELIVVAVVACTSAGGSSDPGAISAPDGTWTVIDGAYITSLFQGNIRTIVATKVAGASEPASYTFSWTNTANNSYWANSFAPPAGKSVNIDNYAGLSYGSDGDVGSANSPALNGLGNSTDLVLVIAQTRGGHEAYGIPGALTTIWNQNEANSDYGNNLIGALNPASSANISAYTFTSAGTDTFRITTLAISPDAISQTKNLEKTDLTTTAPTFGAPDLMIVLTGAELVDAVPTLGSPALEVIFNFAPSGLIDAVPTFGTATFGQSHALTGANLTTTSPTLGAAAFQGWVSLAPASWAGSSPTFGSPELVFMQPLSALPLTTNYPTIGNTTIGQTHVLTASNLTGSVPTMGAAGAGYNLEVANLTTSTPMLDAPVFAEKVDVLTGASFTDSAPSFTAPDLNRAIHLVANNLAVSSPLIPGGASVGTPTYVNSDHSNTYATTVSIAAFNSDNSGATQANAALIAISFHGNAPSNIAVTWNGSAAGITPLSAASGYYADGVVSLQVYGLTGIAGTHDLTASWTGDKDACIGIATFSGIAQNGGAFAHGNTSNAFDYEAPYSYPIGVTSQAGNLAVAVGANNGAQDLTAVSPNQIFVDNNANSSMAMGYAAGDVTSTVTFTSTASDQLILGAVDLLAAPAAVTGPELSSSAPTTMASSLTVTAPTLGNPDLLPNLIAASLTGSALTLGAPEFANLFGLTAANALDTAPSLGAPSLIAIVALAPANLTTTAASVGALDFGRIVNGVGSNLTVAAPTINAATIAQSHKLTPANLTTTAPNIASDTVEPFWALSAPTSINVPAPSLGAASLIQVVALTAANKTTGVPTLGAPAMVYFANLTGAGLPLGSSTLGASEFKQQHNLSPLAITTGIPNFSSAQLFENGVMAAVSLFSGSPTLGSPALGQDHKISPAGLTATALTTGAPNMVRIVPLSASGLTTSATTVGSPSIAQNHILSASPLSVSAPSFGRPALGFVGVTMAANLDLGAPTLGSAAFRQKHVLVTINLTTSISELGEPGFLATVPLRSANLVTQSTYVATADFYQSHKLTAANFAGHAPTFGTVPFGGIIDLAAADLAIGSPVIGAPAIIEVVRLEPATLSVGAPVMQNPSMNVQYVLTAAPLITSHATLAGAVIHQTHTLAALEFIDHAPSLAPTELRREYLIPAARRVAVDGSASATFDGIAISGRETAPVQIEGS